MEPDISTDESGKPGKRKTQPAKAQQESPQYNSKLLLATNAANLLKVKSIITLFIVITFCVLTIMRVEINKDFMLIISNVITYFFAKDSGKKENTEGKGE